MIRDLLVKAEKVAAIVGRITAISGAVILMAMMLLTVMDVLLRFLFHRPIMGSLEITQVMMVSISFITMIYSTVQKCHIKVDILTSYIPKPIQQIIDSIFYLICIVFFVIISWKNFGAALHLKKVCQMTDILEIPIYPFYLLISAASTILVLLLVIYLLHIILRTEEK